MTNTFKDIDTFATACDQPASPENYKMYLGLIDEEYGEAGWDGEAAWREVMNTNFAKIDAVTGKVRKREDGKVLKPEGWQAPELSQFIDK